MHLSCLSVCLTERVLFYDKAPPRRAIGVMGGSGMYYTVRNLFQY